MPSNSPKKVTLSYVAKTSDLADYASFDFQEFATDLFEDKQQEFAKCVRILLGKYSAKGKIVVLSGKSGTGKTTFLKQVLSQVMTENDKSTFIYLPSEKISEINEQYFQDVLRLKNGKRKIVIIEDCNNDDVAKNSFILNSSDGLLSESYDVSYVFTTSKGLLPFRENRIGQIVSFGDLSVQKAQEISLKKNPKFNRTKIRESMTISELSKELEDDKS